MTVPQRYPMLQDTQVLCPILWVYPQLVLYGITAMRVGIFIRYLKVKSEEEICSYQELQEVQEVVLDIQEYS